LLTSALGATCVDRGATLSEISAEKANNPAMMMRVIGMSHLGSNLALAIRRRVSLAKRIIISPPAYLIALNAGGHGVSCPRMG
jgi:hypothetical protein